MTENSGVIDKVAMRAIYSIDAPYVSNLYLTQINGVFRICFCETIPQVGDIKPRCAITVTFSDLMSFGALINNTLAQIMQQQQQIAPPKPNIDPDQNLEDLITKMETEKDSDKKLN